MDLSGEPRANRATLAVLAVTFVVGVVGTYRWDHRGDPPALGDRGAVTATVTTECRQVRIETDGLVFEGGHGMVPEGWRSGSVEGQLLVDGRLGADGLIGTFTATDGTAIPVSGGREVEGMFPLGCAPWGP